MSTNVRRRVDGRMPAAPTHVRARLPLVAVLALTVALLVDVLTRIGLGPVSMSGALTLAIAAGFLAASPLLLGRGIARMIPWPLTLFIGFVVVRLVLAPSADGLQMVAVWVIFGFGIAFAARASTVERAGSLLVVATIVALVLSGIFAVQLLTGTVIYVTRGFALTAIVLLGAAVMVPTDRLWARAAPFLILLAVVVSLSRTASAIGLVMLIGLVARLRRGGRMILASIGLAVAGVAAIVLVNVYPPFRERFLGGDNAVQVGGISFNTSGRSNIWDAVLDDAASAPWFGHAPGSAVELVTRLYAPITQPHNEYLRLVHDLGFVGVALFGLGMLALVLRLLRRAVAEDTPIHWAALLSLGAVLLAGITDNVFVYPFVMLPLAVLVGTSLGMPTPDRQPAIARRGASDARRPRERAAMPARTSLPPTPSQTRGVLA